jgi:hypothetical protein
LGAGSTGTWYFLVLLWKRLGEKGVLVMVEFGLGLDSCWLVGHSFLDLGGVATIDFVLLEVFFGSGEGFEGEAALVAVSLLPFGSHNKLYSKHTIAY